MRRFARDHRVCLRSGPGGYRRFRAACRFGLDLLPPGALAGHILDAGANEGQFAGALLDVAPAARVTAFEPEPGTAARLRARFGSREGVAIHKLALGRSAGTAELHVTGNTVFASLHRPLGGLTTQYPRGADLTGTVPVPVAALDDVVAGPVSLLKIDVQGGERDVLAGARRVLSETAAVLLEVTFVPHYEDEATSRRAARAPARRGLPPARARRGPALRRDRRAAVGRRLLRARPGERLTGEASVHGRGGMLGQRELEDPERLAHHRHGDVVDRDVADAALERPGVGVAVQDEVGLVLR